MATRTFLALPLDEAVVAALARAQRKLAAAGAKVRWVAPENLHLTVKFLGDVEDADLADVCRVAKEAAGAVEPFEFAVTGLAAVPPSGRQLRMIWAGVVEATGRLADLHARAEKVYATMGFPAENRRFSPHLTLGRVKPGPGTDELRAAAGEFAHSEFGRTVAAEMIVMGSELTSDGPVYSSLATAALGAKAPE